ncbi:MAG: hypothetical protein Q4C72_04905 [Eubacteriales bacterium]|nr:hypothetical protein [Eubacteriales bacterium]
MTILLYCIGAALLVLTGAAASGGLTLPRRRETSAGDGAAPEDQLTRDIRALLAYGGEEENDEV